MGGSFLMPTDSFQPKRYPPVGRCIYCGDPLYDRQHPSRALGEEHVIALSLGGTLILPEASCRKCEKITSGLETHCAEQFVGQNREHLGLRTRHRTKPRALIPIERHVDGRIEKAKVPIGDHFAALAMFNFGPAGILLDLPPTEEFAGNVVFASLHPDPGRRARSTGNVNFVRRGGFDAPIFGRMLAKIAHSYAVAERGLGAFQPFLPNLIRGIGPRYLAQCVGGSLVPEPSSSNRHELSMQTHRRADKEEFLVVRLRLFANKDMPTYYIVAGKTKPSQ
jgi:hypothetical protein